MLNTQEMKDLVKELSVKANYDLVISNLDAARKKFVRCVDLIDDINLELEKNLF